MNGMNVLVARTIKEAEYWAREQGENFYLVATNRPPVEGLQVETITLAPGFEGGRHASAVVSSLIVARSKTAGIDL